MKKKQPARRASKQSVRVAGVDSTRDMPEEPAPFGRRRPRQIELDRTPARAGTRDETMRKGSLLRALVGRIFR